MAVKSKNESFMREKKIQCGKNYLEVDIIPCSEKRNRKGKRKKVRESVPKQKNLNDINSKRYFVQLGKTNFGVGDLHVTCTYTDKYLPDTVEKALKELANYLRRIKYHMEKKNLILKYMAITEYTTENEENTEDIDSKPVRIHHHIILSGGLDRNFVEDLWSKKQKGGEEESMGWCNADRLQPNENGIEALCKYLQKRKQNCKRWSSSQNLEKPVYKRPNDSKYSRGKINKIRNTPEDKLYWRNQYPGYEPTRIEWKYNDYTGWAVYIKLTKLGFT